MADRVKGDKELIKRLNAIGVQDGRFGPRILKKWQILAVAAAKILAPKRTGNLKRSIVPGPIGRTSAQIVARTAYAAFMEYGTRAHIIRPRLKKILAWSSNPGAVRLSGTMRTGQRPDIFARFVQHPGTAPRPFMMPGAKQGLEQVGLKDAQIQSWNEAA